ncbi:12387_t:CDS:2, partial [Rhizophagus irregularis]
MNKLRKAHVDRRKLIRCMRIVSQNFWLNIESWHNKFISEDNVNRIKNLLRIMVHIYGFKLALMVYDEEYFPFGRVRYIYSGKLTVKKNVKCLYVIIAAYDLQLQNVVEHLENYFKENDSAWKLPKDFFIISEQRQLKQLEEQWTPIDFMNLEKTIRNCIPHIRFYQMSLGDYTEVKNEFKDILPNGLDDEIMQHFKDSNPLMRIPSNDNILPPRESACPFDSNIINAKDVALIATWINGGKGKKHVFQFKNIHFKFECVYRSSIDGFDKYDNLYKYKRVVIVIKVRNSGEIIGVYNPFGWDISYSEYILFKLFRDFLSRYFIFSLTNRVNPIISYHKEGAMSKISNERHILFGTSDLSINGIYCTSEQHSFKKKIIDKVRFEIDELE